MWNSKTLDKFLQKKSDILVGGGKEQIDKQHSRGKLTARERIEALCDDNSFFEIDSFVETRATDFEMEKKKRPGDGVVTGYGLIHGRVTFIASQDFTVHGGSLGEAHAKKICHVMDLAYETKSPIIFINDSGGARIEEGLDSLAGYADVFYRNTKLSGVVPQIAVILGPCAGGACYSPAIADFIFMTQQNSLMFITGPEVVRSVTGEEIAAGDLGGAQVHSTVSGVAHFVLDNERDCLNSVRQLMEYLPQNNSEKPLPVHGKQVDACKDISDVVPDNPKQSYDVKDVIRTFVDKNSFFEIQPEYAKNLVVGFSRIDGQTVGIVANQSMYMAGALEINASDKGARFVRFCDCFNIPILTLVDVPAFLPGSHQEHSGIIRHGAKLLYAYSEATVPKISLIMRKAYGGAYIAMNSKGIGADMVFAWPIAELAVMGASGAISIIGRKQIKESADPEATKNELIAQYNEKFMNPYIAAERGYVDEVIHPCDTKKKIVAALKMLETKSVQKIEKKHGNIPL